LIDPAWHVARRKVLYLHDAAELDQWRLLFRWEQGHAQNVTVVDYH
jgi:hypothetical protein